MKKHILITIVIILLFSFQYESIAQKTSSKVYWMATIEVPLGKLSEYHAFNAKEMSPVMERYGYKPVATWQTIVGDIQEVIFVAEFENMEAYNKARNNYLGSEEWKSLSKKLDSLSNRIKTRFLRAALYSKLK